MRAQLARRGLCRRGRRGAPGSEHFGSSLVVIGAVRRPTSCWPNALGFLFVAPLCLMAVFLALRVHAGARRCCGPRRHVVVHVAFYKLLRVPLPWGVLTPFY